MLNLSDLNFLNGKRILITGGTGSLGKKLTWLILSQTTSAQVITLSRDEYKQHMMRQWLTESGMSQRASFFLGDVREYPRLKRAFSGVDYVIHTAALKQVPVAEYNPFEFIKTNILGAQNIIDAAIDCGVEHVIALSTDKAANPINLYGATKLCSDKLFVSGNSYSGKKCTRFSVVRYGNVVGSRGSVVPFFLKSMDSDALPITDLRMTRFWITLDQGAAFVLNALKIMQGGEIWVPKIPSMKIVNLAKIINPVCKLVEIGIRPGEKLHEVMIPKDDSRQTLEFDDHFIIKPSFPWWGDDWHTNKGGRCCASDFYYGSDNNSVWLTEEQIIKIIAQLDIPEAKLWVSKRGYPVD